MAAELRKSGRAHDKAQGGKALGGWSRNGGRCDLDGGGAGGAGGGTTSIVLMHLIEDALKRHVMSC
jgi:hypothetical protein